MPTVKAYYNDTTFFPIEALQLPKGKIVNLTVDDVCVRTDSNESLLIGKLNEGTYDEKKLSPEIAKKLAQLKSLENNLERLNETEPLPPEFDEILAGQMNFSRELDL